MSERKSKKAKKSKKKKSRKSPKERRDNGVEPKVNVDQADSFSSEHKNGTTGKRKRRLSAKVHFSGLNEGQLFCPMCGSLLPLPVFADSVDCDICNFTTTFESLCNHEDVTRSRKRGVPKWRSELKTGDNEDASKGRQRATVDEPCPKCGHNKLWFYTMQLRSVDEGQTVFYECVKCGAKFSTNN